MSLQAFTYPLPETRFFHAGSSVYKFKIRYGSSIRGEEISDKKVVSQELEDSVRAVLGNLDNLQPFTTDHFVIFPYKSKWERVSHLRFKHGAAFLDPYPFVCTLYVEMKWELTGSPRGDSELPDVGEDEEAEGSTLAVKRRRLDSGKFLLGQEQDRPMMGTSSRKKPSPHSKRNWPGKVASGEEETEGLDTVSPKDRGAVAGSGSGLEDPKENPAQLSNPLSPEEPPKPNQAGFWGFLSSLFPFRLFGKKGGQ